MSPEDSYEFIITPASSNPTSCLETQGSLNMDEIRVNDLLESLL